MIERSSRPPGDDFGDVEVTLLGGATLTGRLLRFDPGLSDFTLQPTANEGTRRVPFAEVRSVAFLEPASTVAPFAAAREVTVRFFDSTELRGSLEPASQPGRGVFLLPLDGSPPRRIFVPLAALRDIVSVKPLGALLVEQGKATPEMVGTALNRQAELRQAPLGRILVERKQLTAPQLEEALEVQRRRPGQRIGEVLIDLGLLSNGALQAALEVQRLLRGKRLGELLTEMGLVDQRTVYIALALQHYMPFLDETSLAPDPAARSLLSAAFARRFQVLPLSREPDLVRVAVSDAGNMALRDELRGLLRVAVRDVLVLPGPLAAAIEQAYGPHAPAAQDR